MIAKRYTVRAPGKLFVAGEYAITEANQDSIVVAVDRYLLVDVQSAHSNRLDLLDLKLTDIRWNVENGQVIFSKQDERLNFTKQVIETFIEYVGEHVPVHIVVTSGLDDHSGKKYGLGSSAAFSVALLTALLKFSNQSELIEDKLMIYKLASIAHFKAQGNGSCADIAASTYGGWLNYRSFDRQWLTEQLNQGNSVKMIVEADWPGLKIVPLNNPDAIHFLVGWTQETAKTGPMVAKVHQLKSEQPEIYQSFLDASQQAVEKMISGFENGDSNLLIAGVNENRMALKEIGNEAKVSIETGVLTKLIESVSSFGAAKTSGAGGGDCGIAFVQEKSAIEQVFQLWHEVGIEPLEIDVSTVGVKVN